MIFFTISELCKSSTASRLGISNIPDEQSKQNLINLVDNVLDPLRKAYGKPIIVDSGYRCPALNKMVGGAASSQHKTGCAVDIRTVSDTLESNKELFDLIIKLDLPFDQLIWEYGDSRGPDWVHVSYDATRNRRSILQAKRVNKKTVYVNYK